MYMNISEFRKDISNQFNAALTQDVHIERGGITFVLRAVNYKIIDGHVNVPMQRNRDMDKVYAEKTPGTQPIVKVPTQVETAAERANREIIEETRRRMGL